MKFFLILLLPLLFILESRDALTHAALVESSPSPGSYATSNLDAIQLRFDDGLDSESSLTLVDSHFQSVNGLNLHVEGQLMVARLSNRLPNDTYTVNWIAVASDGDNSQGSYQFAVRETNLIRSPLFWILVILFTLGFLAAFALFYRRRQSSVTKVYGN